MNRDAAPGRVEAREIPEAQRKFIDQTLAAVERFDDEFAAGRTDGPMPLALRQSIQQARHYIAHPLVKVLLNG